MEGLLSCGILLGALLVGVLLILLAFAIHPILGLIALVLGGMGVLAFILSMIST